MASVSIDITAFVASVLLAESECFDPITTEDAAYTLAEWSMEGVEIPSDLTPETLASEWNRQLAGNPAARGENTITNKEEDTTMKTRFDSDTASRIYDMLKALSDEPSFDTFEASPIAHYFPDLCDLLGLDMSEYSTYGDLFYALMDAAGQAGIDLYGIADNPARVSLDNGNTYVTAAQAVQDAPWETIVAAMDDDTRERVHDEIAPCTEVEFLVRYLQLAREDLIIG